MFASKKIITLLIILALAGVGVLAYRNFVGKKSTISPDGVDQAKQQEFKDALKKASASDQDLDGVSDKDEEKYKTSAVSVDTDEDGLTDSQEIYIYKTDPLKADTDGDGSADGYEVRRGTNPIVKGK